MRHHCIFIKVTELITNKDSTAKYLNLTDLGKLTVLLFTVAMKKMKIVHIVKKKSIRYITSESTVKYIYYIWAT